MNLVRIVTHHQDPVTAADLFASEGVAAMGWSSVGDLRAKTRDEIKSYMKKRWNSTEYESARMASELLIFRDDVKTGDVVFAYIRDNTVALVGEVIGDYSFNNQNKVGDKGGPVGYAHQVRVKWWDTPRNFSRFLLPKDLFRNGSKEGGRLVSSSMNVLSSNELWPESRNKKVRVVGVLRVLRLEGPIDENLHGHGRKMFWPLLFTEPRARHMMLKTLRFKNSRVY